MLSTLQTLRSKQGTILWDSAVLGTTFDLNWFNQNTKHSHDIVGGRGKVYFIETPAGSAILRHYRRGGLIARFNKDHYFYTGLNTTRAFLEFHLLHAAYLKKLAVPQPLAVRVQQTGLIYRADILLRAIDPATTLAQNILQKNMRIPWPSIGATIAQIHAYGIDHADLNAHNILITPEQNVVIIDFDRGVLRKPHVSWQQKNLMRLKRSLLKIGTPEILPEFEYLHWPALLKSYATICPTDIQVL